MTIQEQANEIIEKMYNDPKTGFSNPKDIYEKIKEKYSWITSEHIKNYFDKNPSYQVLKQVKKPLQYNTITADYPLECVQMDVIVYDRFRIHNYAYIFGIIDVYSRYVIGCLAMTGNSEDDWLPYLKKVFEKNKPKNINCDNQFNTIEFNKWKNDNNINVHYSDPEEVNKNAIIERFNRTIALKLQKWRLQTGKRDWYNVLPALIENYNKTKHSTTKRKPIELFNNEQTSLQHPIIDIPPSLNVNDKVRTKRYTKQFVHGDAPVFSKEIYTIIEIAGKKYKLQKTLKNGTIQTLKKLYKEYELQKIAENLNKNEVSQKITDFLLNNGTTRRPFVSKLESSIEKIEEQHNKQAIERKLTRDLGKKEERKKIPTKIYKTRAKAH